MQKQANVGQFYLCEKGICGLRCCYLLHKVIVITTAGVDK